VKSPDILNSFVILVACHVIVWSMAIGVLSRSLPIGHFSED
jgi:hypothetical protein